MQRVAHAIRDVEPAEHRGEQVVHARHGFNAILFTCDPADDQGHGTHVAGTIGASGNNGIGVAGVNWTTRMMALKFLDSTGSGTYADAISAIDFAVQTKAAFAPSGAANVRILSNSWGGGSPSAALEQEIVAAGAADMLFVVAAGNGASNTDAVPFYPASYPDANIVSVAASDDTDALAGFSNFGAVSVDLAAPGTGIVSTIPGNGYGGSSGTSMATPHVAGAAALVLSRCSLNTAALKQKILGSVDVIPSMTGIVQTNGRLNVDRAIRSCASVPGVSLVNPIEGAIYSAPATIALEANASHQNGISRVEFYQTPSQGQATLIGQPVTTSPYQLTWSNVPAGSYTLTAKAYETQGTSTVSAPVHVTVTAVGNGPSATFVGTDSTTRGNWQGKFGADGYQIVGNVTSYPSYAVVTPSGHSSWTWAASTSDVRALQKADAADRIAATWYGATFLIDVNLTDTATHAMTLHLLDWESAGRVQQIDVRDAVSGALLDTRTASGFSGGQYWTWTVRGHVSVRVTQTAGGGGAVVGGIFFDGGTGNPPPTVTLTTPVEGSSYTAPAAIALAASALDGDGISRVEFYQTPAQGQATLIGQPVTTSPYQLTWSNVAAGSYTLTAKAFDTRGASTVSAPVHVTVSTAGGSTSATFVGTDPTTRGNWQGLYGADGYQIVGNVTNYPSYAVVTPTGQASWTWAASTSDVRALQKADAADRIAATWYGGTFSIDINLVDQALHQVTLYVLDWESAGKVERFDVRDAVSGALLDTRTASGFAGGQYWTWTVRGHVKVQVTQTGGGGGAVVGGVFFR